MADDIDVEALLEAPFNKEEQSKSSSRRRDRSRSRSRDRSRRHRDHSSDRRRDRDERRSERRRSRDRDRDDYDRRRDRDDGRSRHDRSRYDRRSREDHPPKDVREDSDNGEPRKFYRNGEPRPRSPELTPEERDARTVFVWQLSAKIRQRDLEDFFSSVGKIRDVRLIMDGKTKRSKGIAYVEFREVESAQLALGLTESCRKKPHWYHNDHNHRNSVNYVTERSDYAALSALDNEETDRTGIDLGTTGRLALMAKLAEGTGLEIPKAALAQLQVLQGNPTLGTAGKAGKGN
ncbi:RNA-binding protein 39 [Sparganum proliferum]